MKHLYPDGDEVMAADFRGITCRGLIEAFPYRSPFIQQKQYFRGITCRGLIEAAPNLTLLARHMGDFRGITCRCLIEASKVKVVELVLGKISAALLAAASLKPPAFRCGFFYMAEKLTWQSWRDVVNLRDNLKTGSTTPRPKA